MRALPKRLPPWVVNAQGGLGRADAVKRTLRRGRLVTVCEEARCPNIGECFGRATATFMLLGDTCTRRCGFCSVKTGRPPAEDPAEAERVAATAAEMKLRYVVVTMVARDDLADQGAGQVARTVRALRRRLDEVQVEVLTSDFGGRRDLISVVLDAGPEVFGHNLETVERLTPQVRGRATYRRSLDVLRSAAELARERERSCLSASARAGQGGPATVQPSRTAAAIASTAAATAATRAAAARAVATAASRAGMTAAAAVGTGMLASSAAAGGPVEAGGERQGSAIAIKTGLMVGMGETRMEISETMKEIRSTGCDLLTVGQYLQPTRAHLAVARYVEPREFEEIAAEAAELGFAEVASGPLVRSSYRADSLYRGRRSALPQVLPQRAGSGGLRDDAEAGGAADLNDGARFGNSGHLKVGSHRFGRKEVMS